MKFPSSRLRISTFGLVAIMMMAACASPAATVSPSPAPSATASAASATVSAPSATVSAASSQSPVATLQGTKTFSISSTSLSVENSTLLAALDDLRSQGYTIKYPILSSGTLVVDGLARNDFQFALVSYVTLDIAIQKAQIHATNIMAQETNPWALWATNAIQSCSQLQGAQYSTQGPGSTTTAMGQAYIDATCPGTKPNTVVIDGSENREAAMVAGKIDASVIAPSDWVALQTDAPGRFHALTNFSVTLPNLLTTTYAVNTDFATANPGTVVAFLTAILKVYRQAAADPTYLYALSQKYAAQIGGASSQNATNAWQGLFPVDGFFTPAINDYSLQFFTSTGFIPAGLTGQNVADFSYLQPALAALK